MDLEQEKNQQNEQFIKDEPEKNQVDTMIISQDDILVTSNVNLEENLNENQEDETETEEIKERPLTPNSPEIDASLIKSQEFKSIENEPHEILDTSTIEIKSQNDLTVSQEGYFNVKSDDLVSQEKIQESIQEIKEENDKNNQDLPELEHVENLTSNLISSLNPLEQSQESFLNIQNTNSEHKDEDYEIINKTDAADYESPKKNKERETFYDMLGNGSLTKRVIKFGDESKRPLNGQICTISYTARLENGSIVERQDDYQFILGDGDIVPALDMAVSLVELNEECEIISESRHAYGEKGNPPDVPPNSKLIYDLKLTSIQEIPDLYKLTPIERLSLSENKKKRGNFLYNRQSFDPAINTYKKGLKYLNENFFKGDESKEDLEKIRDLKVILLMNVALSYFKLQSYKEALETLDDLLKYQPKHLKALFTKGKILAQSGELEEAIKYFNRALELDEKNADIKKELAKVQAKYQVEHEKEKQMYKKMISGVSKKSEQTDQQKVSNRMSTSKDDNKLFNMSYLTAAGVLLAVAGIGIAAYAKYKNSI